MNDSVLYKPEVQNQIDRIWRNADDPESIADELDDLDRILALSPSDLGESREGGRRIA